MLVAVLAAEGALYIWLLLLLLLLLVATAEAFVDAVTVALVVAVFVVLQLLLPLFAVEGSWRLAKPPRDAFLFVINFIFICVFIRFERQQAAAAKAILQ